MLTNSSLKTHSLKSAPLLTILLLFGLLLPCQLLAKELKQATFDAVVQDLILILSSAPLSKLSVLNVEAKENRLIGQLPDPKHGEIHIKPKINTQFTTVLQIPHKHHDQHTQVIGERFFKQPEVDIIMFNSEQRYSSPNADLTHLRHSLFTAIADAMNTLKRKGRIIQIHGYAANKRETTAAKQADIIISNGTAYPSPTMHKIQICLRDNGKILARLYGRDAFELGATSNQVGKHARKSNKHTDTPFLHYELNDGLREKWVNNGIQEEVLQCMLH